MDVDAEDVLTVDIVIPSIRHDPKKLLSMLQIKIPLDVRVCWYIVSDNPDVNSAQFTHDGSSVCVIVNSENLGAPLSRNVGLEAGNGKYVFFIDDDVIPSTDILFHYVDAIRAEPDAAGYVGPTLFPDSINSFTRGIRASDFLTFFEISAIDVARQQVTWGTTSNILIPRKNIGNVRFSEIFPKHGGGEDIDFCLKIIGNGRWFRTVPKGFVRHGWWGGGKRRYRRFFRWAFGDSMLVKMHPAGRYRDVPNLHENIFFGMSMLGCLSALGIITPDKVAMSAGLAVLCEFAGEQIRNKILHSTETGHPRYGAFPTPDVWYISGGRWPSDEAESNVQRITEHISVDLDTGRASVDHHLVAASEDNNYVGVIQKTTDGGRTWSNSFYEVGGLYFNHIECPLRDTCWVVGEGSSHAAVLSTNDGGETWETQLEFDDGTSLMAAKCINERTCWIAGGRLSLVDFRASVWFTQDAGQTWTRDDSPAWEDAYVTNLDFVDQEHGFATAFHKSTAFTEIFAYRPPQA